MRQDLTRSGQALPHVFTYVNNPVAMCAGLAVLELLEEESIVEHAAQVGDYLQEKAQDLTRHACVGQVRGKGLMLGIELVQDRRSRKPFPAEWGVSRRVPQLTLERGLAVSGASGGADWVEGDDLRFYPPLIITQAQLDESSGYHGRVFGAAGRGTAAKGLGAGLNLTRRAVAAAGLNDDSKRKQAKRGCL